MRSAFVMQFGSILPASPAKILLFATALVIGSSVSAQESPAEAPASGSATQLDAIEVTGSRILREDYIANSPTTTVSREDIEKFSDITLETFLNTLPQVNPAGTITSNNPGNGGQANIDLRGLGANRNLVLINGRRPMVSGTEQTVDLNTIPKSMIERVEIITGGAGAVYGADALAGAINIILKKKYEGVNLSGSYIDSEENDAQDRQISLTMGNNFWENKANFTFGLEYADRQSLIKSQREFAKNATATTSFLPEGLYFPSGNNPNQLAIDSVFGSYAGSGYVPGGGATVNSVHAAGSLIGFNLDGTLFSRGVFNSPRDVINFRYPIDGSVNSTLFPDLYSYNFDFVNILVLPFERYSGMGSLNVDLFDTGAELFAQMMYTNYVSSSALAPSPIHTSNGRNPIDNSANQWSSNFIEPGRQINQLLLIPATNPFIPDDFAAILASRTGNNANLVGSGATEPFLIRQRTLSAGLRQSINDNTVEQNIVGLRGPVDLNGSVWNWEAYYSQGKTNIPQTQLGNINAQNLQTLLEDPDGGTGICDGGFNPFGRRPVSQACLDFLQVVTNTNTSFTQDILSGYVRGDVASLPAGAVQLVLGAEHRRFEFEFIPGAVSGPIDGFNTQVPAAGRNSFRDVYVEALLPIVKDMPFAEAVDVGLGYRISRSKFSDGTTGLQSTPSTDSSFKVDLSWAIVEAARARASYQRSVRAPNFGELFSGGSSAPQYFDPCSATTQARLNDADGPDADMTPELLELCRAVGAAGGNGIAPGAAIDSYVQTPGSQLFIETAGNTKLKPEIGDTLTVGAVFDSPWQGALNDMQLSVDYYQIKIGSPILVPESNLFVASCYNYFGTNPDYDAANENCAGLLRVGATDIFQVLNPVSADGVFPGINSGSVRVSGIDAALNYGLPLQALGRLAFDLRINRLLEYKQQDPGLPEIDYTGTVSYFGQGLGASSPDWKINLTSIWTLGDFSVDARTRYIHGMENRISKQFPGEIFSGTPSVTYWDLGTAWRASSSIVLRVGMVNVFDKQPPVYRPNVQSGTDPSLFDIYGRRAYMNMSIGF